MQERLAGIEQRASKAVSRIFGSNKERRPEYPLSPVERDRLENEIGVILKKEDFGGDEFGIFCKNMISLVRQENDQNGFARLRDRKAKYNIDFNKKAISIRGDPVATDDPNVFDAGFYERISYSRQKMEYGFFGNKRSDFQPILTTRGRVPVPETFKYFSYVSGESEPVFPDGSHDLKRVKIMSDEAIQAFCKRVYAVYNLNKASANSLPR